jgi:hypothetical protein
MSHAWIAHLYTMDRNLTPVETALTGSVPSEVSSGTDARCTGYGFRHLLVLGGGGSLEPSVCWLADGVKQSQKQ